MTSQRTHAITSVALFAALLATGLSAGFFYGWQVGAIPGLRTVDAATYVRTMNGINGEIRNAGFAAIFFGSAILMLLALLLRARHRRTAGFVLIAAALLVYLVGTMLITFVVHVPMNVALLEHADLTGPDVDAVRDAYETRWNAWHLVRSAAAVLAFALLLLATFRERGRSIPLRHALADERRGERRQHGRAEPLHGARADEERDTFVAVTHRRRHRCKAPAPGGTDDGLSARVAIGRIPGVTRQPRELERATRLR